MKNHTMLAILAEDVNTPEIAYLISHNDRPVTRKSISKAAKTSAAAIPTVLSLLATFFIR